VANPTCGPYGTPTLDDFNRADGDPGNNWVAPFIAGETTPIITGGELTDTTPPCSARWSALIVSADCEVWGKIRGYAPFASQFYFYARAAADPNAASYFCWCRPGHPTLGFLTLCKSVSSAHQAIAFGSTMIAGNTYVALVCIGRLIQVFYWDGSTWVLECSAIDAGVSAPGYLGVEGYAGHIYLDNFGGGSLVPENYSLPTLSGTAQEGRALSVSDGSWSMSPTSYACQWRRCDAGGASCADILGATLSSYIPSADDVGSTIRCVVTASNAYGSGSATSEASAVVTAIFGTALASYNCRVAWDTYQSGLITFGYSLFDGVDVFAPSPFAATYLGEYDDVSTMLASAEVTIGRDSNLTWLPASSAQITLRDPTGLLNPENLAGPLLSALIADRMHPITLEGDGFSIFSGWIREITWEPTKRKGYAHLDCVDLTYFLNKAYPIIAATGATTTGAAIGLILDAIDWTDSEFRDLDIGDDIPDFSADGSETALSLIEGLLDCERGTFYIAPDGVATYRDRSWRQTLDSVALIEDEMSFVAPGVDFDAAITRARVERLQSGYIAEAVAPANDQRKLGWNDLPPIATPYLIADAGADSLADWLVWVLGQPRPPMHELALDNRTAYQLYQILARSFGERITVVSAQTGQSGDYHIEQIRHAIGGTPRHVCNLLVSRVIAKALQFGYSAFDGTDVFVY